MAFKIRGAGRKSGRIPLSNRTTQPAADESIEALLSRIEQEEGIPAGRLTALAKTESNLNPTAKNPKSSATGMFQFIDATGKDMGLVGDNFDYRTDPEKSARAAAKMLRSNAAHFNDDWDMAVQAHHTGRGAVSKYGGPDPENPESVNYLTAYRKHFTAPQEPPKPSKPGRKRLSPEEAKAYMAQRATPQQEPEQDRGWWNNVTRGMGERAGSLFGDFVGAVGDVGTGISMLTGTFDTSGNYLTPGEVVDRMQGGGETVLGIGGEKIKDEADFDYQERKSWDDVKTAYGEGNLGWVDDVFMYAAETGVKSVPDMVGAVANLPSYIMARAHEIGGERAKNKGKERQDAGDTWEALPWAAGTALLERIGAKGIVNAGVPDEVIEEVGKAGIRSAVARIGKDMAKAGSKEAVTEAVQEGAIEYLGGKAGTGAQLSVAEAADLALAGAVAGGVYGGAAAAPSAVGQEMARPTERATPGEIKITPAAERQIAEEEAAAAAQPVEPVMKAEINEQDIADNIEIVAAVLETGDTPRVDKLVADLTEAYGPHTAKAILTQSAKKVKGPVEGVTRQKLSTREQPAPAPAPEAAPAVAAVPTVAPPAEPIIPTQTAPALPDNTRTAVEIVGGVNNLLDQETKIRSQLTNLKGQRGKRAQMGLPQAPLLERIDLADTILQTIASNIDVLGQQGYDIKPLKNIFQRQSKKGMRRIGIEKARQGGVLRNVEIKQKGKGTRVRAQEGDILEAITPEDVEAATGVQEVASGRITHAQLTELFDRISDGLTTMMKSGPALAARPIPGGSTPKPVERTVKKPVGSKTPIEKTVKKPTVADKLRAKQAAVMAEAKERAEKEAAQRKTTQQEFKEIQEREAEKRRVAEGMAEAKRIKAMQPTKKAADVVVSKRQQRKTALQMARAAQGEKEIPKREAHPVPAAFSEVTPSPAPTPAPKAQPKPRTTPKNTVEDIRYVDTTSILESLGGKRGNILNETVDAVVSPANSNGDMNGGVDMAYMRRWPRIESTVKKAIEDVYGDNQMPIGEALVVQTGDKQIPNLIVAPTMSRAGLQSDPKIAGQALMAALKAADDAGLKSVAVPGLGTGIGATKMNPQTGQKEIVRNVKQNVQEMARAQDMFEAYQDGSLTWAQATGGYRSDMDVDQVIQLAQAPEETLKEELVAAPDDTRKTEIPAGSSKQEIRARVRELVKQWQAENKGERMMFLFHGTSKQNAEGVAREPRLKSTSHGIRGVFAAPNPDDAVDWAAAKFGDDNVGLTAWAWTEEEFNQLMERRLITRNQMYWGEKLSDLEEGKAKSFTEYVISDAGLAMIYDDRVLTDLSQDSMEPYDTDTRIDIKNGRESAIEAMDVHMAMRGKDASVKDVVSLVRGMLDDSDPYAGVIDRIVAKGVGLENIQFYAVDTPLMESFFGSAANGLYQQGRNNKTREQFRRIVLNDKFLRSGNPAGIKTFVHELVHAATMGGMRTDSELAMEIAKLRRHTIKTLKEAGRTEDLKQYGLKTPDEFVAEAMSNPSFQRLLAGIKTPDGRSLWSRFVRAISAFLNMPVPADSVLSNTIALIDKVMVNETQALATMADIRSGQATYVTEAEKARERGETDADLLEKMAAAGAFGDTPTSLQEDAEYVTTAYDASDDIGGATEGGSGAMRTPPPSAKAKINFALEDAAASAMPTALGIMTGDAIQSAYADQLKYTAEVDGQRRQIDPLTAYNRAKMKEQAEAKTLDREAEALNAEWTSMAADVNAKHKAAFEDVVLESTMYQVDPSVAWMHRANAKTRGNRAKAKTAQEAHRRLRLKYLSMDTKAQTIYKKARDFYSDTYMKMREQIVLNVLDMYDVNSPSLRRRILASRSVEDLEAIVPPMVTRTVGGKQVRVPLPSWPKVMKTFGELDQVMNSNGPYFPQMRFGDNAIEYSKTRQSRGFSSKAMAEKAARTYRANNPGSKTGGYTQGGDNLWTFTVTEKGFSLYETRAEARAAREELQREGFEVSSIGKKADITFGEDTATGRILSVAGNKLKGPGAERSKQALREALITMLPETSMQKRMLKRKNIRGASKDSQRVFAGYAQSAGHHLAKLKHRKEVEDSFNQIMQSSKELARQGAGDARATLAGNVANEIQKRHNMNVEGKAASRIAAKLGFLGYLFSLSYSAVNATQPLLMTIPYLGGKYGGARASAALAIAYKKVSGQVALSSLKNLGGLKGAIPGETVDLNDLTNNIIASVKENDPDTARMLSDLADLGTLDATFSLEISKQAQSKGGRFGKATDKLVEIGRVLPYTIEIMNRATTAVAAYELAREAGRPHAAATEAARVAIVKTQFDYTMENRPRYFKANELTKIMTMFKIHPLGVYTFLVTNTRALARSPQERKEAARALRLFMYTHAAFAGVAGSLLAEPIRAALGLIDLLFGDEDEDDWLSNPEQNMRDAIYDNLVGEVDEGTAKKVAEVFVHGLPRAAGFDMSSRVGVQNLMVMWQEGDNVWDSLATSVEKSLVGPIFGASDGISRGVAHAAKGGSMSKSLEYMAPKGLRDLMRSYRYGTEGMTDFNGNVIADSSQFSNTELAMKAFGFMTSTEADMYDKRALIKNLTTKTEDRRRALLRKFGLATTSEERAAVSQEIKDYNEGLPSDMRRSHRITGKSKIEARTQRRRRARETREGIYLPRNQRRLRERVRSFQ